MRNLLMATPLLLGLLPPVPAFAQTPPTPAQARAADTRQGSSFTALGSVIFYQDTGHGTPIILIHGYPLNGALFQNQQTGLSSSFRIITLDLPGFGLSSPQTGLPSTATYAAYVLALMNHLGLDKAVIGGHSMGGLITQELYREAPQRFLGMILIDTTPKAASTIEQFEWAGFYVQSTEQGVPSILPNLVPMLLTGNTLLNDPAFGTEVDDIIDEASVSGAQDGAITLATRPDYTALLPTIAVPTLVVEGVDDSVYAFPIAQQLHAGIVNSTLALIPNAAHVSILEQPAAANAAISSWAKSAGF